MMKLLSLGWLAALLLPIGMVLALLGFWIDGQAERTGLQILGIGVLCMGVAQLSRVVNRLSKDAG